LTGDAGVLGFGEFLRLVCSDNESFKLRLDSELRPLLLPLHEANLERQTAAALSIQTMHRGNSARQATIERKHEIERRVYEQEQNAAMSIQAVHRGNSARSATTRRRRSVLSAQLLSELEGAEQALDRMIEAHAKGAALSSELLHELELAEERYEKALRAEAKALRRGLEEGEQQILCEEQRIARLRLEQACPAVCV
jgi:exonuclease VII small subunit